MSVRRIQQYYNDVANDRRYSNTGTEYVVSQSFFNLISDYAQSKNLRLIPQLNYKLGNGKTVRPDGTLKDAAQLAWGFWESKDEHDDLETEIDAKFGKGYPDDNILFEDSQRVVLFQAGKRVHDVLVRDAEALDETLSAFVTYEPAEVRAFHTAIDDFKENIPVVLGYLRNVIEDAAANNADFVEARARLLELAQKAINPHLTALDIREMVIQHILTEDIFLNIFNESQFHRENNIAKELNSLTQTFFTGKVRQDVRAKTESYYSVIRATASRISDHHEKQTFLKIIYENFYKIYNPKAADRMGIVYTPNEIVRFMIQSTDYLLDKHFDTLLSNRNVNILDPATGTGTFVTELIEYIPPHDLKHKYENEIFCNELSLLSYYTANLNIEYTYAQKMQNHGGYVPFDNIAFVDTLENFGHVKTERQSGLFELTAENLDRIKRQNEKEISVIIGNPPYNANQLNENDNNKNRPYPAVDQRIKDTYVKESTAQKTKVYDMYSRFIRWASDRLNENGIIAFVVNRSFIDSRTFDGFRKVVADEFDHIYVVDLGGDVRANPKLSGPKHNVFAIQTGVAIMFLVRDASYKGKTQVRYVRRPEMETAESKFAFLRDTPFQNLDFERIQPDKHQNWINQAENDWNDLIPTASRAAKMAKAMSEEEKEHLESNSLESVSQEERAIFKLYSLGVVTNRDDWVYDFSSSFLAEKVEFFIQTYNREAERVSNTLANADPETIIDSLDDTIKWTRAVKNDMLKRARYTYHPEVVVKCLQRPFVEAYLYFDESLNEMQYQVPSIFPKGKGKNRLIAVNVGSKPFNVLASDKIVDLHFNGDSQCLPRYRYDDNGNRLDNITDWGVKQFRQHYRDDTIDRDAIFHYVYAVLHDPIYRAKYELNLKREFPRIPFYDDFGQWTAWGKTLMDAHINFEDAAEYNLTRKDKDTSKTPKAKLKADKDKNHIILDDATTLEGVPAEAWAYKLGNRSALEWVLDRYKEKKPRDPTIREKFDTYRFTDYKEDVITLLKKVCTVSAETVAITRLMEAVERS